MIHFAFDSYDFDKSGTLDTREAFRMIRDAYDGEKHMNTATMAALSRVKTWDGGECNKQQFVEFVRKNESALYPILTLQREIRKCVVGENFWLQISKHLQKKMNKGTPFTLNYCMQAATGKSWNEASELVQKIDAKKKRCAGGTILREKAKPVKVVKDDYKTKSVKHLLQKGQKKFQNPTNNRKVAPSTSPASPKAPGWTASVTARSTSRGPTSRSTQRSTQRSILRSDRTTNRSTKRADRTDRKPLKLNSARTQRSAWVATDRNRKINSARSSSRSKSPKKGSGKKPKTSKLDTIRSQQTIVVDT